MKSYVLSFILSRNPLITFLLSIHLSIVGHQEVLGTLVTKHIHDSLFHNPDIMCLNCKLNLLVQDG